MREHEISRRFYPRSTQNVIYQHTFPGRIQLGPACHTMNVARDLRLWQRVELRPIPRHDGFQTDFQCEAPPIESNVWRRPGRENGKVINKMLTWGDAIPETCSMMSTSESTCHHVFAPD